MKWSKMIGIYNWKNDLLMIGKILGKMLHGTNWQTLTSPNTLRACGTWYKLADTDITKYIESMRYMVQIGRH